MMKKQALVIALLPVLLQAIASISAAEAQQGTCKTWHDCKPKIEEVFEQFLSSEALEGAIAAAADYADPPNEADPFDPPDPPDFKPSSDVPMGEDPPKPRPGQANDVVKAVLETKAMKSTLKKVKRDVIAMVKSEWDKLTTGMKVAGATWVVSIATNTVMMILADARLLKPTQNLLNSAANAALGKLVPGLAMKFDLISPNKNVKLTLDILPLLRDAGVEVP